MIQQISESSQRFYQPSYEFSINQNNINHIISQRNQPTRQGYLNRNNIVSSSMTIKSGKLQENNGIKLRR